MKDLDDKPAGDDSLDLEETDIVNTEMYDSSDFEKKLVSKPKIGSKNLNSGQVTSHSDNNKGQLNNLLSTSKKNYKMHTSGQPSLLLSGLKLKFCTVNIFHTALMEVNLSYNLLGGLPEEICFI